MISGHMKALLAGLHMRQLNLFINVLYSVATKFFTRRQPNLFINVLYSFFTRWAYTMRVS